MRRHITFSLSTADALKTALSEVGQHDEVLSAPYGFEVGPIRTDDAEARAAWMRRELGADGREEMALAAPVFLANMANSTADLLAWVSRRSAAEYAGFLWWLSHVGDAPVMTIDVPGLDASFMQAADIEPLLSGATALTLDQRAAYRREWERLRQEDAPLRVISGQGMISASMDHFDELLLRMCGHDWKSAATVVGDVFEVFAKDGVFQAGDLTLQARLTSLGQSGRLNARGDIRQLWSFEVRLPSQA